MKMALSEFVLRTFVKSLAFSFDLVYDDFEILPDGKFLCHDIQGRKGESKIWVR